MNDSDSDVVVKYPKRQIGQFETILDSLILEIAFLKAAFQVNACLSPSVYNTIDSGPSPAAMIHGGYCRGKDLVKYLMEKCNCPRGLDQKLQYTTTNCTMSMLENSDPFDHIASFLRLSVVYYTWVDEYVSYNYTRKVYYSSLPFPFSYTFYYLERNSLVQECKSKGLLHEIYVTKELEVIYKTIKPLLVNGTFGNGKFTDLDVVVFSSMAVLFSLPIKSKYCII